MRKIVSLIAFTVFSFSLYGAVNEFMYNDGMYEFKAIGESLSSGSAIDGGYLTVGNRSTLIDRENFCNRICGDGYGMRLKQQEYRFDHFTFAYTTISGNFDLYMQVGEMPSLDTNHANGTNQNPHVAILIRKNLDVDSETVGQAFSYDSYKEFDPYGNVYAIPFWRHEAAAEDDTFGIVAEGEGNFTVKSIPYDIPEDTPTVNSSGPKLARIRRVGDSVTLYYKEDPNSDYWIESYSGEDIEWLEDLDEVIYFGVGVANGLVRRRPFGVNYTGTYTRVAEVAATPYYKAGEPYGTSQLSNFTVTKSQGSLLPFSVEATGLFFGVDQEHLLEVVLSNEAVLPDGSITNYTFKGDNLVRVNHTTIRFDIGATNYFLDGAHHVILKTKWDKDTAKASEKTISLYMTNLPAVESISFPGTNFPITDTTGSVSMKIVYTLQMDTTRSPQIIISNSISSNGFSALTLSGTWDSAGKVFSADLPLSQITSNGAYSLVVSTNGMVDKWSRQLRREYVAPMAIVVDSGYPDDSVVKDIANFVPPVIKFTQTGYEMSRVIVNIPSDSASLEIVIYDYNGKEVKKLYQGTENTGVISKQWDGKDEYGRIQNPGSYFARIRITTSGENADVIEQLAPVVIVY